MIGLSSFAGCENGDAGARTVGLDDGSVQVLRDWRAHPGRRTPRVRRWGSLPVSLPGLLADGEAAGVEFTAIDGPYGVETCVRLARDEHGQPQARMTLSKICELSPDVREEVVGERYELARSAESLPPGTVYDPGTAGGYAVEIPVLPDSFPRLVTSPGLTRGHTSFRLDVRVLPGHTVRLMDALAAIAQSTEYIYSEYVFQIDVDDDQAVDALLCIPEQLTDGGRNPSETNGSRECGRTAK